MADVHTWDVSMGSQRPGDQRSQEAPLSSNDLKMCSINQTVLPCQAGDTPLSTSTSMHFVLDAVLLEEGQ